MDAQAMRSLWAEVAVHRRQAGRPIVAGPKVRGLRQLLTMRQVPWQKQAADAHPTLT